MHSQGSRDLTLAGMGCTFTGLVLRGRLAHVLHVGDTRAYRLSGQRLTCLTTDHVREDGAHRAGTLYRALGVEPEARLDYIAQPMARHDRFLLCSDGCMASMLDESIADICGRSAPSVTARALVAAAMDSGSTDNCTALVLDVVELPTAESTVSVRPSCACHRSVTAGSARPSMALCSRRLLSEGALHPAVCRHRRDRRRRCGASSSPSPRVAEVTAYRQAFLREAWVGARVDSPWLGRIIELPQGRQTSLYTVMPLYQGELLETRITRSPVLGLEEGRHIAIRLARAAAALHRDGIIHRDIKPDNVILEGDASLKLIDLGVVRVPGLEDFPPENIPGTAGYVAPEMLAGDPGSVATDVYALGVTLFRAFTGEFPYGIPGAAGAPVRDRPKELTALRPDLPSWLQDALARAIAVDPAKRYRDMSELAADMEAGPARAPAPARRPLTLYERAPLQFWKGLAALLALALVVSLLRH